MKRRAYIVMCVGLFVALVTYLISLRDRVIHSGVDIPAMKKRLTRVESLLGDWPQLSRYAAANAELPVPEAGEERVVFIGDSITEYWDNPDFGGFFPDKPYVNRGISGQTTAQMLARFRQDVVALRPKVVVISGGTNDIFNDAGTMTIEVTENNLASMAEIATAHGIRVVLASVLPVNYGQSGVRPPESIVALNRWIKDYCAMHGHTYLDYHSAMIDEKGMLRSDLSDDGLHPNAKGYAIMTPLARQAITRALTSAQ